MSATIHYHDIGDYLSREEKLKIIDDFGDISGIFGDRPQKDCP